MWTRERNVCVKASPGLAYNTLRTNLKFSTTRSQFLYALSAYLRCGNAASFSPGEQSSRFGTWSARDEWRASSFVASRAACTWSPRTPAQRVQLLATHHREGLRDRQSHLLDSAKLTRAPPVTSRRGSCAEFRSRRREIVSTCLERSRSSWHRRWTARGNGETSGQFDVVKREENARA